MLPPMRMMVLLHRWACLSLWIILRQASLLGPCFQRWTPWRGANKPACNYLPQGRAPRFPYVWLKTSSSPRRPHNDWVDHRWQVHRTKPSEHYSGLRWITSNYSRLWHLLLNKNMNQWHVIEMPTKIGQLGLRTNTSMTVLKHRL